MIDSLITYLVDFQTPASLDDIELVAFLHELIEVVDMKPISDLTVTTGRRCLDTSIIIAESHVAIHYHKQEKIAFLTLVSCKEFQREVVDNLIKDRLEGSIITPPVFRKTLIEANGA